MQAISQIDVSKIILKGPSCITDGGFVSIPFGEKINGEMRFVNILYPRRSPFLCFTATVVECKSLEFGTFCIVRPETKDLEAFERLEILIEPDEPNAENLKAMIDWDGTGYEHRPTLNSSFELRLKMPSKDDGTWKFETNVKSEDDALDTFLAGLKVDVVVSPGLYFNDNDHKYGMYYTLKSIFLSAIAKPVKTAKLKK